MRLLKGEAKKWLMTSAAYFQVRKSFRSDDALLDSLRMF